MMDDNVCQVAPEWWGAFGDEWARPRLAREGCEVCPAKGDRCLSMLAAGGPLDPRDVSPMMVASGLSGDALVAAVNRLAGGSKRLRPCGTAAAYRRHVRRGEEPCAACRAAQLNVWQRRKAAA